MQGGNTLRCFGHVGNRNSDYVRRRMLRLGQAGKKLRRSERRFLDVYKGL